MTDAQIKDAFAKAIEIQENQEHLNIDRRKLFKYRNPEKYNTSIAAMLEVLYRLDKLTLKDGFCKN